MNENSGNVKKGKKEPVKQRRGIAPLIVFSFLIAFVIFLFSRHEPLDTIACTPEIIASDPDVIMLGTWWCGSCHHAKRFFQNNNIHYCEYDVENTVIGKQLYQKHGATAVPILLIGEYRLIGFNAQRIEAALASTKANQENTN